MHTPIRLNRCKEEVSSLNLTAIRINEPQDGVAIYAPLLCALGRRWLLIGQQCVPPHMTIDEYDEFSAKQRLLT
ncbi:hypothetical protein EON63_13130 [archaeon]|nr:MAG: hypothetical protein EON63_13130 [archaeon]